MFDTWPKTQEAGTAASSLLANALRKVFTEAVTGAVEPLQGEVADLREDMDQRFDTANKNMRAQFAKQQKEIGKVKKDVGGLKSDVGEILKAVTG